MKILLLEDDQKTAQGIIEMLPDYEVLSTSKSDELLAMVERESPDLLLIDFDLKEKDGLLVYRDVRKKYPLLKTIMFSSSNSIPLAVQATKLGVSDFLRKPLEKTAFINSVKAALVKEEIESLNLSAF